MFRKLVFAASLLTPATAFAAPAAHFMKDAIHGDYSEMTLGKLIAQRGSSAQVRDFGLARRMHLNIRPDFAPEARTEYTKLQHLRGRAFDREVKRYMVHDHQKDIAEFKAQARNGDRRTSEFATQTIPVLQKHLDIARSIRG
jgi:putative membrane protein